MTISTPICPNTNAYAHRLYCIWVYYFNIRQILTTHYVGQLYNCGINFKMKTKQNRGTISHMTSPETSYLFLITAVFPSLKVIEAWTGHKSNFSSSVFFSFARFWIKILHPWTRLTSNSTSAGPHLRRSSHLQGSRQPKLHGIGKVCISMSVNWHVSNTTASLTQQFLILAVTKLIIQLLSSTEENCYDLDRLDRDPSSC